MPLTSDSRLLHQLEEWQGTSKGSTRYLAVMDEFQMRVVTSAKKVATRSGEKEALPVNFKRRIKDNFVDTLCFLFDGIFNAAMSPSPPTNSRRPTRASSFRIRTIQDIVRLPSSSKE